MKHNLKTFPSPISDSLDKYASRVLRWKWNFEAELRERLKKLNNIRQGKQYVLTQIAFTKEILGE